MTAAAATTPKTRTRRSSKKAAEIQAPVQEDLPLELPEAPAPEVQRPSLASTIDLATVSIESFRYHSVTGGSYVHRKAIFNAISMAPTEVIMALPIEQRKRLFYLCSWETKRYYGTAVRSRDSEFGKRGEPLPKLSFATGADAISYREAIRRAGANLRRAVFGDQ